MIRKEYKRELPDFILVVKFIVFIIKSENMICKCKIQQGNRDHINPKDV